MRLLRYDDLRALGVPFSRVHLDRLQASGLFPRKIKIGGNTAVYREDEIVAWIQARCAERPAAA